MNVSQIEVARSIISMSLEVSIEDVPENASMDTFAPWDSLGHLRIVAQIEEHLNRSLEIEEVLGVIDCATISNLIENNP